MIKKNRLVKLYIILLACSLFALAGCQQATDPPPAPEPPEPDNGPAVYVAGAVYTEKTEVPCFWKNGIRTDMGIPERMNPRGRGSSVFVSGKDVFVAGWIHEHSGNPDLGSLTRPCFWMNGIRSDLELPGTAEDGCEGAAASIQVANGDVYVAGWYADAWNRASSSAVPCMWKNGTRTDLSVTGDEPAHAYSILVSGNDVYVAGDTYLREIKDTNFPCYWKNGVRVDLPTAIARETIQGSRAKSICISGEDIYVAGNIGTYSAARGNRSFPCVWKNGRRTDLSTYSPAIREWGSATFVFVSGTDVYVAGDTLGPHGSIPCYWKNGSRSDLSVGDENLGGWATAICFSGGDVYVAGVIAAKNADDATIHLPCFWKNGVRTGLSVSDASKGGAASAILFLPGE